MDAQTGLRLCQLQTLKTGFLVLRPIITHAKHGLCKLLASLVVHAHDDWTLHTIELFTINLIKHFKKM